LRNNETYYLHVFFYRTGKSPKPTDPNYNAEDVIYGSYRMFI